MREKKEKCLHSDSAKKELKKVNWKRKIVVTKRMNLISNVELKCILKVIHISLLFSFFKPLCIEKKEKMMENRCCLSEETMLGLYSYIRL